MRSVLRDNVAEEDTEVRCVLGYCTLVTPDGRKRVNDQVIVPADDLPSGVGSVDQKYSYKRRYVSALIKRL